MQPDESGNELPVALDALATSDGTTPSVGDDVEVKVQGKVSSINGDCAYVTPETCNGQPVPDEGEGDMSGDDLMQAAQSADNSSGY